MQDKRAENTEVPLGLPSPRAEPGDVNEYQQTVPNKKYENAKPLEPVGMGRTVTGLRPPGTMPLVEHPACPDVPVVDCRELKPETPYDMPIPRKELLALHATLCSRARELMYRKNHDYAHDIDAFRNFRKRGLMGILTRWEDKMARLESFMEQGELKVADESIEDTIIDAINYAVIWYGYYLDTKK